MQRVQKQSSESENAQRTAQAKFTSKSREGELANGIDDSPAMIAQRKKLQSLFGGAIQRQGAEEEMLQGKFDGLQRVEEEEPLQGKFEAVQRVEEEEPLLQGKFDTAQRVEEDEPLQGKFEAVQRVEEEEPLQGKFAPESVAQLKDESAAKPNNTGLPDNLKSGIESLSGMSMDNVKVHYNSSQPAQLNALAYAQGTDIHVAPGQEQHLPHEAWHVVQQAQGRVKPTMQMKEGVPVNDDKSLEHEADVMGAKAVQMRGNDVESQDLSLSAVQRTPSNTVDSNLGVSQLMKNGETGLEEQKEQLERDIAAIGEPSMEEFRRVQETRIRDFAATEYDHWGGGSSYTPWYKDTGIPSWNRIGYRMCEDRRMGKEPGHCTVTKNELKDYLDIQDRLEQAKRIKRLQAKNVAKRDIIQR